VFVVRFIAGKFENIIIFKCLHLFEEWGGLRVVFAFCHSSNCSFLNYAYNAAYQWGPLWANKKVYVHCDNQTAVAIINKESCVITHLYQNPCVRCFGYLYILTLE